MFFKEDKKKGEGRQKQIPVNTLESELKSSSSIIARSQQGQLMTSPHPSCRSLIEKFSKE